uniref:NADH-ubiquinone oxidoreductase chain 2 n=1 Tax=Orithyia sinica TaxID=260260 RepID=A0A346RN79_9EUCA|nr:NADH dehydrogenase subunit 2 [Orithyia sinica]AXS67526.1 NADH dehydrogenase subunit 2 [Orithyia sinica]
MMFPLTFLPFYFSLMAGTILAISSSSWFGAWVGLELNLMSFIPIITMKMNMHLSEAALKYFLVQALGSTFIIMSSCLLISFSFIAPLLLLMGLLLKLGSAPFHFWFPQVMEGLMWPQAFTLLSIQKIAPMTLISYVLFTPIFTQILLLSAILSAMIGAIGGLNSMQLRKIMAFSSINHMSWMMVGLSINNSLWITYFSFYTIISGSVILFFFSNSSFNISSILSLNSNNPAYLLFLSLSLLSLGGLPPFTGFIPKWMMIQVMVMNNMFIPLVFLLLSTLITLYFYLRIITSCVLIMTPIMTMNTKITPSVSLSSWLPMISFTNIIGLFVPLIFLFF